MTRTRNDADEPHAPEALASLRARAERTLREAPDPASAALPLLHRLVRLAPPGSEDADFATRNLAELLADRSPWRAAVLARRLTVQNPDDDRAWATLALCHTLLGHYRAASAAYERAVLLAPDNATYAHNLGHLLDLALDAPARAVELLAFAHRASPGSASVAASYAHALARAGRVVDAARVVDDAARLGRSRELEALGRWIARGAPEEGRSSPRARPLVEDARGEVPARRARRPRRATALAELLDHGLARLPLDPAQRASAKALARDAGDAGAHRAAGDPEALAAAIAFAVVYVDGLPLTAAEVAAPFRVAVSRLRGRFADLRTRLELTPGDARYRSGRSR